MTEQDKEKIYLDFSKPVCSYLAHKTGNSSLAEDLCADVFIKVYANLDRYDAGKASLSTWIYRITRNTLYDYYRTSKPMLALNPDLADDGSLEEDLCSEETLNELADALECLSVQERDLILFHYYKNETLRTIAERFGLSYSYIKIIHANALKKMKSFFDRH